MIEKLIISRFRGIKSGIMEDFGKINILAGENNTGKTSVLEALYWLSVCGRDCRLYPKSFPAGLGLDASVPVKKDLLGHSPCSRIWVRHGKREEWAEPQGGLTEDGSLYYNISHLDKNEDLLKVFRLIPPQDDEIKDIEKFEKDDLERICEFVLKKTDIHITEQEENITGIEDILKQYIPNLYTDDTAFKINENWRVAFTWYPNFIYEKESLAAWAAEGKTFTSENVLFFDFHIAGGHFEPEFSETIKDLDGWRLKLTNLFGKIFNQGKFLVDIDNLQGMIEPADKDKKRIPIDDFGDGARHAFKVLASLMVLADRCKDGKEGMFLWEDPELFMHPKSLYLLLELIIDMTEELPIQIFMSTQSLDLIKSLANILNKKPALKETSRVFRMELREGELISSKFTHKKLHTWLKHGSDPRFWNQRDVINYEADEEAVDEE